MLCYLTLSMFASTALTVAAINDTTPNSPTTTSALHKDEKTAATFQPQVHHLDDGHTAEHHALLTGLPVTHGAAKTP